MSRTPALLVGTRKGAFILRGDAARRKWTITEPMFLGHVVHHVVLDRRDGRTLLAAAKPGHLGPTVFRSNDRGKTWKEAARPPAFPKAAEGETGLAVAHVFWLAPGHTSPPNVWYAGTSPQGLFRSEDGGETWDSVAGFNAHPKRAEWVGRPEDAPPDGATLHSINIDPRDPQHMYIGLSAGGVFETRDGGRDWAPLNAGCAADFLPDPNVEYGHDPHCVRLHPDRPDRLYQQNHCGIYRMDRPEGRWIRIGLAMPKNVGDIGFPMVLHPRDPDAAWVFPMDGTEVWPRTSPGGRPALYATRDAGKTWQRQDKGLPERAWLTVKRQAMTADGHDPAGVYFGSTNGEIWGSRNEGGSWARLAGGLPHIYALEASGLPVIVHIASPLRSYTRREDVEADGLSLGALPVAMDLSVDMRVLAFTIVVAIAATLAFGMVPALTASRVDLVPALKGDGGGRPRHSRLRSSFLIAQVAMSILLLVTAGLFVRSFRNAQNLDTGFESKGVLTAAIDLETRGYSQARAVEFYRSLVERLEARPGIQSANLVDIVPLTLSNTTAYLLRDGDPRPGRGEPPATPRTYVNSVGPGHFKTLQIPMIAGRDFTHQDGGEGQVAIVNETFARLFWPGKPAVGQRLHPLDDRARRTIEVIGVVRDSKYITVGEASTPFLYRPLAQEFTPRVTMLVRSAEGTAATIAAMKQEVRALDAGLPLFNVEALVEATSVSLLPARVAGGLLGALGILALALAALGIYGVLSFLVRSRTREIGIRVAVGATPRAVAAMVVRQAMAWTIAGVAIGIGLALALTRFLASFLYGISATDPWTFATVTVVLAAVACAAALAPALRASRMDPLVALRTL